MASAELRVGVIGAGRWATMAHLPAWKRDPRCELVAVCDVAQELADNAARDYEIPAATTRAEDLIANDDIEVIDVVTGDDAHFELTMDALEAGKHVLVEKPVAHDFRDTLRARDLAAERGLKTKVGFTFRYSPAVHRMKELIDEGWIASSASRRRSGRRGSGPRRWP